jgi:predicted metalloprotease
VVLLIALVVLPVTGAAGPHGALMSGEPLAGVRIDPPPAGDVAIRRVPDREAGPRSAVENDAVAAVLDDLQTYWTATLPTVTGASFAPLRGGAIAVDSAVSNVSASCVTSQSVIAGNAFYCPEDDSIVYDSSALVPVLLGHYGSAGLVAAFAHEFGHAIQSRIGPTPAERTADPKAFPSLLFEAEGDCYAGTFFAWVLSGKSHLVHFDEDAMLQAVGPLVDFRDPVTVPADDPAAHGLGLDRMDAVLLGLRDGASACHALTTDSLHAIQGTVPVPPGGEAAMATPRYASTAEVLAAATRSIAAFAGSAGNGSAGTATQLADPADLRAAAPFGQFAQATALALAVGRDRAQAGASATYPACFAGAWAASVYGHAAAGALGSWPGDADEGFDLVRSRPGATFSDAAGYADGFRAGLGACS